MEAAICFCHHEIHPCLYPVVRKQMWLPHPTDSELPKVPKEYALNHIGILVMIYGIFLNSGLLEAPAVPYPTIIPITLAAV